MLKHAYLIVANGNFSVVKACLKMIDDARNDIFLLLDSKAKVSTEIQKQLKRCVDKSNIEICEQVVNWAGYSQISAVLNLLEKALSNNNEYQYLHFLQGSDLPIRSQDEIHDFFNKNNGKEFVQIEYPRKEMANRKAWYRHFFCHNRYFRKNRFVKMLNFGLVEVQKIFHIKKNTDIELYQGSALFSITGKCAKYILLRKDEIHKRFHLSLAADEVFMQTMLMESEFKERVCDVDKEYSENARLIDRTRPDGKNSPHIWRKEEFETLINADKNKMFARKFDEKTDIDIVEKIYNEVCCND